jgi:hypothetical protein
MSISQLFPEEAPTLNLNFAGSKILDPRITFTRTSSGTYMGSDGLIKVAPADAPRFDHRYVNGEIESLGLLVEEQRSNSIRYSTIVGTVGTKPTGFEFASSIVGQSCEVSTDFDIDGNGNCIKHIRGVSGDNNVGYPTSLGTLVSGTTYTFSVYVYIPLSQKNNITSIRFGPDGGFSSATFGFADLNITDRWQRVIGSFVSNGGGGVLCRATASNGAFFYTDAWQFEQGTFATSYIPRPDTSTATRTADNVSMVGDNFSDWYNPTEGTFFVSFRQIYDASATVPGKTPHVLQAGNATTVNDNYTIRGGESNTYWTVLIRSASPSSLQFPGFNPYPYFNSTTQYKAALSVNSSLISVSLNGLLNADTVNTTTVNHTTQFNKLFIGSGTGGGPPYELTGTISQLIYYPTRLPNAQLISLTR